MIKDLWEYMKVRKKWWLLPTILMLIVIGGLIIIGQSSVLSPFIYALG
jgi:hypothetical protein